MAVPYANERKYIIFSINGLYARTERERGVGVGHAFGALIWGLKLLQPSVLDELVKVWRLSKSRPISDR